MPRSPTSAVEAPAPASAASSDAHTRRAVVAICALLAYQGFTMSINGVAAPWIGKDFQLTQSGIATLYAWISPAAIGALVLSRLADRVGRRRVLLGCLAATPLCALGAALSARLAVFVIFDILVYACAGATLTSAVVVLAEELPIARRARGQSFGGLAMGFGGGICVLLMPVLDHAGWSWRWLLGIAGGGLLGLPLVWRLLPESRRWMDAAASGATSDSGFTAVFTPAHRRRSVPILVCFLLSTIAGTAAGSWTYYHAVSVVGLSAALTSTLVIIGGGLGMLGFPLGAWAAERVGRVRTVVCFGCLIAVGSLGFYWGPPRGAAHPVLWLGLAFCGFSVAVNAATVAGNAAATELFPTAVRGTMMGWFALIAALGSVTAQAAIAVLARPLGGLSVVVGYLGLLAVPSAVIFGLFIDETRGLSLEAAAGEIGGGPPPGPGTATAET